MEQVGYYRDGYYELNADNYEARQIDDCARCGGEVYGGGESGFCAWCEHKLEVQNEDI